MFEKFKNILIFLLLSALVIIQFITHSKDLQIQQLSTENFQLNNKLKSLVKINDNKIQIVYRYKDSIKYIDRFIPPESNNTTITTDNNGKVDLKYSWYGAGFWPFLGVGYSDKVHPLLGARFIYVDRFGLGALTTFEGMSLFIDVRTDWKLFENSSFGLFTNSKKQMGLSVHTFF